MRLRIELQARPDSAQPRARNRYVQAVAYVPQTTFPKEAGASEQMWLQKVGVRVPAAVHALRILPSLERERR